MTCLYILLALVTACHLISDCVLSPFLDCCLLEDRIHVCFMSLSTRARTGLGIQQIHSEYLLNKIYEVILSDSVWWMLVVNADLSHGRWWK